MFQNITTDKPLLSSALHILSNYSSRSQSDQASEHDENEKEDKEIRDIPENDDNDSHLPVRTSLDSLRICLFCNKECTGVKRCLDHMREKHSFYILDVDCLISLKGLLTYIAERIQLGYLCLFCSKMFRNARRCQQHMMDKAHCFMNSNDEHEYEQYYDFSKTYEGHPDAQPLITTKTGIKEEIKEEGEEWEDVDVESGSGGEDVSEEEDEAKKDEGFSIITDEQSKTNSFSMVEGKQNESESGTSQPF